jgi:hypothetical protein
LPLKPFFDRPPQHENILFRFTSNKNQSFKEKNDSSSIG